MQFAYNKPTLRDYAMIGDCRTAALISKTGSIDWLCLPDFSSSSLFAKLLDDEQGGYFSITLPNLTHTSRRYLPNTAIVETTLLNKEGCIRITDCMPVTPEGLEAPALVPLRELLRRIEIISGDPEIEVCLDARPHYASKRLAFRSRGKLGWAMQDHSNNLSNLLTDFPLNTEEFKLRGRQRGEPGDIFWFSLTFETMKPAIMPPLGEEAEQRIATTAHWWKHWCTSCHYQGQWRDEVLRSAITLKLLTFTVSGALMAAATTSLPERPGGWMNWDYRYCWPRDAALTLSAFVDIGFRAEADAFFGWLMVAANGTRPRLRSIYDIYGVPRMKERVLPLAGFGGAKPVRIGNEAAGQVQHDVYGEVLMAVEDWIDHFGKPQPGERRLIEGFGKAISDSWRNPDHGIWEIRDKQRHYTYSKAMAWHVFDCLIRLHEEGCVSVPIERYIKERDELRTHIENEAFDKARGCYLGVLGENMLDASLLLLPHCGFIAYNDPRMLATWEAIQQDLEVDGLILRYPPGFAGSEKGEGALLICNFWAVDYLTGCGRHEEARARLERLIGFANDVGLFNEGVDVKTHEALGNLPQAFSHAGLIHSVTTLFANKARQKSKAA